MTVQLLDPADAEALERFERAFHAAFARHAHQQLTRRLWQWDDAAQRIRPHVPYEDVFLFALWDERGEVDTAALVNWRLNQVQAARLGFVLPPPPAFCDRPDSPTSNSQPLSNSLRVSNSHGVSNSHCEILALFSRCDADLVGLRTFLCEVSAWLLERGLRSADATCCDRLLPFYRHIGGQPLARCSLEGESRTLLRFPIAAVAALRSLT